MYNNAILWTLHKLIIWSKNEQKCKGHDIYKMIAVLIERLQKSYSKIQWNIAWWPIDFILICGRFIFICKI